MNLIGYWIRSIDDDEYPPPQELVAAYDDSTRSAIADYLDGGCEFAAYRGVSWCRFFCRHPMGNSELTDGEWVWPQGLSHYVRDHNVKLPEEFTATVFSKSGPTLSSKSWSNAVPDDSFWIARCAAHRSNSLRLKLTSARNKAEAEMLRLKSDAIAERERREGVSDDVCRMADCDNFALLRRALCASCILETSSPKLTSAGRSSLGPILKS